MDRLEVEEKQKISAMLREKKGDSNTGIGWMYKGDRPESEEYLLGKRIDKHVEGESEPPQDSAKDILQERIKINTAMDMAAKMREDPLFAIRRKEEESRKKLLENPVKMKQLQKLLELQHKEQDKKSKKKKKKSKKKMKKKSKGSDLDNDSSGSDDGDDDIVKKYLSILTSKNERKTDKRKGRISDEEYDDDSDNRRKKRGEVDQNFKDSNHRRSDDFDLKARRDERVQRVAKNNSRDGRRKLERKNNEHSHTLGNNRRKSISPVCPNRGMNIKNRSRSPLSLNAYERKETRKSDYRSGSPNVRNRSHSPPNGKERGRKEARRSRNKSRSLSKARNNKESLQNHREHRRRDEHNIKKDTTRSSHRSRSRSGSPKDHRRNSKAKHVEGGVEDHGSRVGYRQDQQSGSWNVGCRSERDRSKDRVSIRNEDRKRERRVTSSSDREKELSRNQSKSPSKYGNRKRENVKNKYRDKDEKKIKRKRSSSSTSSGSSSPSSSLSQERQSKKSQGDNQASKQYGLIVTRKHRSSSASSSPSSSSSSVSSMKRRLHATYQRNNKQRRQATPPRQKLTEDEKKKRLEEMMDNAKWRDQQREGNVKRYLEEEEREQRDKDKPGGKGFLSSMMVNHASSSSVEDRLKRNKYNIQRTNVALDKKFTQK